MSREALLEAARGFFKQCEVQAVERVIEVNRGGSKRPKPRIVALCSSRSRSLAINTMHILHEADSSRNSAPVLEAKDEYALSRVTKTTTDASSVLTIQFRGSGSISLSFESRIQREMFMASLRKLLRDAEDAAAGSPLTPGGAGFGDQVFISSAVSTVESAARARRQHEKRISRKAAWNAEDEASLLSEMERVGVSVTDLVAFRGTLDKHISKVNDSVAQTIIELEADWKQAAHSTQDLLYDIDDVEVRLETLAKQLLERKRVIEDIEHTSTNLQRRKDNLVELKRVLGDFQQRLGLTDSTEAILSKLADTELTLVQELSYEPNARMARDAMNQISGVMTDRESIFKRFQVSSVNDRMSQFHDYAKTLAYKSKDFVLLIIDIFHSHFEQDEDDRSSRGKLVWKPHIFLHRQIHNVGPMLKHLHRIDPQRYSSLVRHYTSRMQASYARETKAFFAEIRREYRRCGWRGYSLLGNGLVAKDQLTQFVEAHEVPIMSPMRSKQVETPAMTSSPARSEVLTEAGTAALNTDSLTVELPNLGCSVFRNTHAEGVKMQLIAASARSGLPTPTSVVSAFTSKVAGDEGFGGPIRPDTAFAVAVEATADIVLAEESVLNDGFGLEELMGSQRLAFAMHELFGGDGIVTVERDADGDMVPGNIDVIRKGLIDLTLSMIQNADMIYAMPMLTIVKMLLRDGCPTESSYFMSRTLRAVERTLIRAVQQYTADQIESIKRNGSTHEMSDTAVLKCFANLPVFLSRLEAQHNVLDLDMAEMTQVADHVVLFIEQVIEACFEALDATTILAASSQRMSPAEQERTLGRSYFGQYRHHAYFCCIVTSMEAQYSASSGSTDRGGMFRDTMEFTSPRASAGPMTNIIIGLLRGRFADSVAKRNRYGELYLTRYLFMRKFGKFASLVSRAEGLRSTYGEEELRHQKAITKDEVFQISKDVALRFDEGCHVVAKKIRAHCTRDITDRSCDEGFHVGFLQHTWQRMASLLEEKVKMYNELLTWPAIQGVRSSLSLRDAQGSLQRAVENEPV